ncbi:MAG: SMC family ATPase, partial [Chloroflexi bacterium]|nr:SMC family ATPase [Chloroflexota bacterium]
MKPLRLELKGFTAFRETAVVDFEDRRLFVITGPTGAGKSSLLDAITWVLYGQVPRVGASTRQLVTHGANAMSVRFDFSTRGRRYRVSRRAPGNTATRLERETETGEWEPLADRARDVTEQVTKILGLDYQTFIRTVLLPQNAFDSFLKGDQRERREIMSRLLGLGVYADARGIAGRRAGQARTRAETLTTQLARIDVATPEAIAAMDAERDALAERSAALADRRERLALLADLARADREASKAATAA